MNARNFQRFDFFTSIGLIPSAFAFSWLYCGWGGREAFLAALAVVLAVLAARNPPRDFFLYAMIALAPGTGAAALFGPEPFRMPGVLELLVLGGAAVVGIGTRNRAAGRLREEKEGLLRQRAGLAHEFGAPLAALLYNARALREHIPPLLKAAGARRATEFPPARLALLRSALEDIEHTSRDLSTLVELSLGAEKKPDPRAYRPVSMKKCLARALELRPYRDREEKKWLRPPAPDQDFLFLGEEVLMVHVILNLLINAFSSLRRSGGGEIRIALEKKGEKNELLIWDSGAGMKPGVLKRAFERGFSGSGAGSGLGLAFCRETTEAFGGTIYARSQEGEYAEFRIVLENFKSPGVGVP